MQFESMEAHPKCDEYRAALAAATMEWNRLEGTLRTILSALCGLGPHSEILTVELGNVGLSNALLTVANDLAKEPVKGAVLHALKCFDTLREYRNYYVHGIQGVVALGIGKPKKISAVGLISMSSAKGRLVDHTDLITKDQVDWLGDQIQALRLWSSTLALHINAEIQSLGPPSRDALPSLQERPALPGRLQKRRRFRLSEALPPQSSQA